MSGGSVLPGFHSHSSSPLACQTSEYLNKASPVKFSSLTVSGEISQVRYHPPPPQRKDVWSDNSQDKVLERCKVFISLLSGLYLALGGWWVVGGFFLSRGLCKGTVAPPPHA